MLSDIGING